MMAKTKVKKEETFVLLLEGEKLEGAKSAHECICDYFESIGHPEATPKFENFVVDALLVGCLSIAQNVKGEVEKMAIIHELHKRGII